MPTCFIWLLAATAALGQTRDLASFQDSVQRISSVDQLRTMLARRSSRDTERSPVALTERGFVALRLWDLTSQKNHSRLAEESFKKALKQKPDYGWAHYGLGLTYVDGPNIDPGTFVLDEVLDGLTNNDIRIRAHREFIKALDAIPPVGRAADLLADNAAAKNETKPLTEARDVLMRNAEKSPDDPAIWVALSRVQTELDELDNAVNSLDQAVAHGVRPVDIAHQRAALMLRVPGREDEGARAWFAGIGNLTTPLADEYFDDIMPLLSRAQVDEWQKMDLSQRKDFLRTFWDMRAAMGGVTLTHRMAEHYRRLATARRMYYRRDRFGAPAMNSLRMLPYSQRSQFDDRGVIFIRHGTPRDKVGGIAGSEYESWVYASIDGGPRAFHFEMDPESSTDYHLMFRVPCEPDWVSLRVDLDPRLAPLQSRCDRLNQNSVSANIRMQAFEAIATDTDFPRFIKELPFFFDLYTFRAPEGRTDVVAAVAVPREKLNLSAVESNPAYRIDLSLILVDTITHRVIRQDDSVHLASQRSVKNDDLFRLHVEVAVPPSKTTVQRVIVSDASEPGVGQLYGGPFPIPDYSGSKFMISDVVLADPSVTGRWKRGDVHLALVPTGYFKGGSFNIFYELYNIRKDAAYVTEIEVEPIKKAGEKLKGLFGGGRSTVKFKFDGVATSVTNGTLQELRRVDAPLGAGTYKIKVTVKNSETGETVKNERIFSIP